MTMRLIASSDPSEVDRFETIDLLARRAVLTRAVCRELMERPEEGFSSWRADISLGFLLEWIQEFPESERYFQKDSEGKSIPVPKKLRALVAEIRDGMQVCKALAMLQTADRDSEYQHDMMLIEATLDSYWKKHRLAALIPSFRS